MPRLQFVTDTHRYLPYDGRKDWMRIQVHVPVSLDGTGADNVVLHCKSRIVGRLHGQARVTRESFSLPCSLSLDP